MGVEAGKTALRFASLRKTRNEWMVLSLKEIVGQEGIDLFYAKLKDPILVSALSTRDTLMRPCEIPLKKSKDIFAALDFHIEPLLPYAIDKAVTQAQIVSHQENSTSLNVFAIRKDRLSQHLEQLKTYRLEPEIVTTRAHALAALSTFFPQSQGASLLVHEAEEEISLVLADKGCLLAARSIDNKKDLFIEIQKTILNFSATHKSKMGEVIYFFGKDEEIKNSLQKASGKSVLTPSSPFPAINQEEFIHYSLSIGSALAGSQVNFRQKEFTYPHPFKRVKKPLISFFILSFLMASTLYLFGETALSQKQQELERAYFKLLKSEKVENFKKDLPQTAQEYSFALRTLEKEIRARPDTFPLLPQVPKVKEVVSWLTSLARQQGKEGAITLESLHYQMVKHPDFGHKQEKYKVRIDLELSAKDPNAARAFQEALKESSSLADTHEEIQWLPVKGKYKVVFFLKDKTRYV